jgi:DNA-binding response OmpR family regulator
MTEETAKREDTASDDGAHPRIIVVGQSPKIVQALESEFIWRGWIPVVVDDLNKALEAIECKALSAVVVPLSIAEVADGRFCPKVRERYPHTFVPIVAYAAGVGPARVLAWTAGCDAFVSYNAGAAGLCREVAILLTIAREVTPLLLRRSSRL